MECIWITCHLLGIVDFRFWNVFVLRQQHTSMCAEKVMDQGVLLYLASIGPRFSFCYVWRWSHVFDVHPLRQLFDYCSRHSALSLVLEAWGGFRPSNRDLPLFCEDRYLRFCILTVEILAFFFSVNLFSFLPGIPERRTQPLHAILRTRKKVGNGNIIVEYINSPASTPVSRWFLKITAKHVKDWTREGLNCRILLNYHSRILCITVLWEIISSERPPSSPDGFLLLPLKAWRCEIQGIV